MEALIPAEEVVFLLARLFHEFEYPALLLLALLGYFTLPRKNAFISSLALALLLSLVAKAIIFMPRPCAALGSLVSCPSDSGVVSGHAAAAAVFFMASRDGKWFWFFAQLAVFIALSRLLLNVHDVLQVLAGAVAGYVSFRFAYSQIKN